MRSVRAFFVLLGLLALLPLAAQAADSAVKPYDGDCCHSDLRLSLQLGGAWEHYTGENKVTADAGDAIADRHHYDLDFDIALYFKPTTSNLMFGLALDLLTDSWNKDPNFARISQVFFGLSTSYYLQGTAAKGVFVHGDVGPVAFVDQAGTHTGRTDQSTTTGSPLGFGLRVGAGYAFAVSEYVSLLATVNYGFRTAGASTSQPVTLTGGVMF